MNKKVLIVAEAEVLRSATARAVSLFDFEAVTASHNEALVKFLEEEPQAVIIWDYAEKYIGAGSEGRATYNDIKSSASPEQKIVRCGFETHDYDDYVRAPFQLEEILRKIS
ncbi:MAG: hypothetical protein AAB598_00210 [Patescibacteria group bacterium]